ncbi:MAG: alpha/beta hydrolase [Mycolicibacterium sp.]|nr:alpha/beta hydrolase [Mycolicibacterium sp.]
MTAKRIQLTSGALHVESNGDPLGRLILCVHGLSANCRSFDRFVPVLAEAGHHIVTMDLRGRGRSEITPPGSYGWDSHVRDLLEIAERYGADSFVVIGHSMGGFIGLSLAAQYPRRCSRLVLVDAVGEPEPSALPPIMKSVSRLGRTYQSVQAALAYMQAAGTIAPWDEFWDSYFGWELEPLDDTVRIRTDLAAVVADSAYASMHQVSGLWPRLRCPALLVRASRPMTPGGGLVVSRADAERFAAEAREATVVDVDADHYSILISPPAISAVARFVGAGTA